MSLNCTSLFYMSCKNAMPLLKKLNGYQYHWKDPTWHASLQTGLLAQEVEKVLPELVKTDDKGMKV